MTSMLGLGPGKRVLARRGVVARREGAVDLAGEPGKELLLPWHDCRRENSRNVGKRPSDPDFDLIR